MLLPGEETELLYSGELTKIGGMVQTFSFPRDKMLLLDSSFRFICWDRNTRDVLHHGQIKGSEGQPAGPVPCYTPWIDLAEDGETLGFVSVAAKAVFRYNMRTKQVQQSIVVPKPPAAQKQAGFSRFDRETNELLNVYFNEQGAIELVVTAANGEVNPLGSMASTEGQLMIAGTGKPFWVFCFQSPVPNQNQLFFANTKTYGRISLEWQGIPCGLLVSRVPQRYDATGTKYLVHSYFNQSTSDNSSPGLSVLEIDSTKLAETVTKKGGDLQNESHQHLILKPPVGEPKRVKVLLPDAIYDPVLNQVLIRCMDQTICQIRIFGQTSRPEATLVRYLPLTIERGWKSCTNYEQTGFSYFKASPQNDKITTKRVFTPNIKALTFWMLESHIPDLRVDSRQQVLQLLLDSSLY